MSEPVLPLRFYPHAFESAVTIGRPRQEELRSLTLTVAITLIPVPSTGLASVNGLSTSGDGIEGNVLVESGLAEPDSEAEP
ncbi:hypothetical protein BRD56_08745 [Thermoplasmatales archaeon SW_10_69_26]|nr:MAG: hypothetical protein BRD56_08745 [Thermoplasmatales archaeon SW_10_69_26]